MDRPSLNALLHINGLSPESSPEEIKKALLESGYAEKEIPIAIGVLHGEPVPDTGHAANLGEYVAPVIDRTAGAENPELHSSVFVGRISAKQFWLAGLLSAFIFVLLFFLIEITALPLFSIFSGVSFLSLPDLALAPLSTVLLVGVGITMFAIPFVLYSILIIGLQIRRYHDLGLSASAWISILLVIVVLMYVTHENKGYLLISCIVGLLVAICILSWKGSHEPNEFGPPIPYDSVSAALIGSPAEDGNGRVIWKRFIVPILVVEAIGLVTGFVVHMLLPRVPLPKFPTYASESTSAKQPSILKGNVTTSE